MRECAISLSFHENILNLFKNWLFLLFTFTLECSSAWTLTAAVRLAPCTADLNFKMISGSKYNKSYRCCRRAIRRRCPRCRPRRRPWGPWWPRPCARASVSAKDRWHCPLSSTWGWETPLLGPFSDFLSVWCCRCS